MADTILLDNQEYHFSEAGLPCLITYREKMGGSQFTVSLVTDLFLQGSKVLFFTAYLSARENFLEQIKGMESKTAYVKSKDELENNKDAQFIILESGDETLFLEAMKVLPDINERIVLVKNMEVFSQAVFDVCLPLSKVMLSGNIDECTAKKQISDKKYETIIIFSPAETPLPITPPPLEKYTGYFYQNGKAGLVTLKINK